MGEKMKNKVFVFLIYLALTGSYFGWAKGKPQNVPVEDVPPPVQSETAYPNEVAAEPKENKQFKEFPQQPVTRPLLEMIYLVKNDIKGLPYFLSDSVTLEYIKITQNLEVSEKGEVTLREVTIQDQIHIKTETSGTLVAISYDAEGRMLLAINFDESDDAYPLIFREEGVDRSFYLVHQEVGVDGKEKKIYYGQALYDLQTQDNLVPRLQIQFEEVEEAKPTSRTLPGHRASFSQPTPAEGL